MDSADERVVRAALGAGRVVDLKRAEVAGPRKMRLQWEVRISGISAYFIFSHILNQASHFGWKRSSKMQNTGLLEGCSLHPHPVFSAVKQTWRGERDMDLVSCFHNVP